jgi:predicted short-subunit dehydrogenase-like oxidoreductase (DUF2520 family)
MKPHKISFVGAGKVAWHLSRHFEKAGHSVCEIYSRNPKSAAQLADSLYHAEVVSDPDFRESKADIFLLTVSDDAIESVCRACIFPPNAVVAHTSGGRPIEALSVLQNPKGVLYPLQTFSKGKEIDISQVPFCLEFDSDEAEQALYDLAASVSKSIYLADSHQRRVLHVAAVFACNFTNHLWTLSQEILQNENLDFDILKPLIAETIEKTMNLGPENAQTGPAARKDMLTIEQHSLYLSGNPALQNIYKVLTDSILKHTP